MKKYKAKKDKYTTARGGWSTLLSIFCTGCGKEVLLYQKDGPGPLKRMYLDKMLAPALLVKRAKKYKYKSRMAPLRCDGCREIMATPMVYEKEKRLAQEVIPGKLRLRKSDGLFPRPASKSKKR